MGACFTEQIESLKIDLNGFLQSSSLITAERGRVERLYLFFFCSKLPASEKILWRKPSKKWQKTRKKRQKRLKNSQKTIKNSRKIAKNRAKTGQKTP